MKCKATVFEHNKGVFHLGQCPECYQSNVINETESHSDIEAVEVLKKIEIELSGEPSEENVTNAHQLALDFLNKQS